MINYWRGLTVAAAVAFAGLPVCANAATLQLDFGHSFGDVTDPGTTPPDGAGPYLTALFDDGDTPGSVTLTLTVAGDVGTAEVTAVYLNVDDAIGAGTLTITPAGGSGPGANSIGTITDNFQAGADGFFDILFDLPPPGGDRFTATETLIYTITDTNNNLVASSFFFLSTASLDPASQAGPYYGAAKFQSTGGGENSDWVAVVPVPAAVWLFGSGLLGLVGVARRRRC